MNNPFSSMSQTVNQCAWIFQARITGHSRVGTNQDAGAVILQLMPNPFQSRETVESLARTQAVNVHHNALAAADQKRVHQN
jgi:hypothetical protein